MRLFFAVLAIVLVGAAAHADPPVAIRRQLVATGAPTPREIAPPAALSAIHRVRELGRQTPIDARTLFACSAFQTDFRADPDTRVEATQISYATSPPAREARTSLLQTTKVKVTASASVIKIGIKF